MIHISSLTVTHCIDKTVECVRVKVCPAMTACLAFSGVSKIEIISDSNFDSKPNGESICRNSAVNGKWKSVKNKTFSSF